MRSQKRQDDDRPAAFLFQQIAYGRKLLYQVTFFLFSARVYLYSWISQPALAVAVEVMHGTFSLFLVASVEYINGLVPRAWRATGQSLFWAAYFGAGSILGNSLAGYLHDRVGVQGMFRLNGYILLGVALAGALVLREDG